MTRIKYTGPQAEVRAPHVDGREFVVKRDGVVDVPSGLADRLLEQAGSWKKAGAKKDTEATTTAGGN